MPSGKAQKAKSATTAKAGALDQHIVDRTVGLAAEVGWEGVRLRRVAEDLGITLPELRSRYRDLDAIADAWFRRALDAMLAIREVGFADLPARVRRPLVLVSGAAAGQPLTPSDEKRRLEIVLALPGNGSGIVAFHAYTGDKLASFELPEAGGRLVGRPLATPDGRIVVARQKYSDAEASLLVLQLVEKTPVPEKETAEPLDETSASGAGDDPEPSIAP